MAKEKKIPEIRITNPPKELIVRLTALADRDERTIHKMAQILLMKQLKIKQ